MRHYKQLLCAILIWLPVMATAYACDHTLTPAITETRDTHWYGPERIELSKEQLSWDDYCPKCTLKNSKTCQERPCQKYNLMIGTTYHNIQVKNDPWITLANKEALKSVQHGGGPFAAIVLQIDDKSKKVIRYWVNHNHVVEWHDPTAHAELTTLRAASFELGVTDLGHIHKQESKLSQPGEWSHCVIYSSAEPCPMCMSAIYWAGIKQTIFAATRYDAAVKGVNFADDVLYKELHKSYAERQYMRVFHANTANSLDAFNYYKRNHTGQYGSAPDSKDKTI